MSRTVITCSNCSANLFNDNTTCLRCGASLPTLARAPLLLPAKDNLSTPSNPDGASVGSTVPTPLPPPVALSTEPSLPSNRPILTPVPGDVSAKSFKLGLAVGALGVFVLIALVSLFLVVFLNKNESPLNDSKSAVLATATDGLVSQPVGSATTALPLSTTVQLSATSLPNNQPLPSATFGQATPTASVSPKSPTAAPSSTPLLNPATTSGTIGTPTLAATTPPSLSSSTDGATPTPSPASVKSAAVLTAPKGEKIEAFALSNDGRSIVASLAGSNKVIIYNKDTPPQNRPLPGITDTNVLAISEDNNYFAGAPSKGGEARIWRLAAANDVFFSKLIHNQKVKKIAFTKIDQDYKIATYSEDTYFRVSIPLTLTTPGQDWKIGPNYPIKEDVKLLTFDLDANVWLVLDNNTILFCDKDKDFKKQELTLDNQDKQELGELIGLVFNPVDNSKTQFYTLDKKGKVQFWLKNGNNLNKQPFKSPLADPNRLPEAIGISKDGKTLILAAKDDSNVYLWEIPID